MSATKTRETIALAFAALERAADESTEASRLLSNAFDAALDGERRHRRMGRGFGNRHKQSAETAARYFVVKWFLDPAKITNAREAAAVRLDCLYASALRGELADRMGKELASLRAKLEPVAAIDYVDHIASAA